MVIETDHHPPRRNRASTTEQTMNKAIVTEVVAWTVRGVAAKAEISLMEECYDDAENGVSGDTGRRAINIDLMYGDEVHYGVEFRALTAAEKAVAPAGAAGKVWKIGLMQARYDEIVAARAKIEAHPVWVEYQDALRAGDQAQARYDALHAQMRVQDGE